MKFFNTSKVIYQYILNSYLNTRILLPVSNLKKTIAFCLPRNYDRNEFIERVKSDYVKYYQKYKSALIEYTH